jgi:rhomboid protease GluP
MKIEFKQKQTEQLPLDNLGTEQFLNLAIETSKQLGWIFGNINETGFIAYTNNEMFSWNAEVKIKIADGIATLQSQCEGNSLTDVKENKKNLQNFTSTFKSLKNKLFAEKPGSVVPLEKFYNASDYNYKIIA